MILPTGVNNFKGFKSLTGFTLVEIMISVLILGCGLALVANSYVVALKGTNAAMNNIAALSLAKDKLEALEALSLKEGLSVSSSQEVLKSSNKNYNYVQDIIEIDAPEELAKSFVQVCASISWQEQNSTKNVTLSTYLPKKKEKE